VGWRTSLENVERDKCPALLEIKHQLPSPAHSLFTTMTHFHFVFGVSVWECYFTRGPKLIHKNKLWKSCVYEI
jgi:hypothetical protein